ncbi:MAG: type I methionyl aminopeptidase, partial [Thiomonas sp.]
LSAQWEHTVLVTPAGFEVLTTSAGCQPAPAFVRQSALAA